MSKQVVITGANGWIGGKLARHLSTSGWDITGVSRTPQDAQAKLPDINWVGLDDAFDDAVQRAGAMVNLAGRNLLEQSWDDDFKAAMYQSRIDLTKRVVKALQEGTTDEKVLVSASGYPIYGNTGDKPVTEEQPISRSSFLYALDADWEDAARTAELFGARVAVVRIGLVFGADGGAFPVLKQPFDQGMGVILGTGDQWIPWIHIDDIVALLAQALTDPRYQGPINAVAPNPVQQREFAQVLAGALGKPCEVTVPAPQVRQSMGEASELVLMSSRLVPQQAMSFGFEFRYPEIDGAIGSLVE